ncbi:MAG: NAD(P)-binding domain-containing protein [Candidatus Promineifilaceae bacterium]
MTEKTAVAIVGAGPIGIELAIALQEVGVKSTIYEAGQLGDAFTKWPPATRFFSTPEHAALAGIPVQNVDQLAITGEQYLAYLRMLVEYFDLDVHLYHPVKHIEKRNDNFVLRIDTRIGEKIVQAEQVVLATGGMASPRMLNIPGEDLPHVTHYFQGPHPYFRQRLLVVGGRNSAVEAALRCWRVGAQVAMSYRRENFNFDRIKPHLSMDLGDRLRKGEIQFFPATVPVEITPVDVVLAEVRDGVVGAEFTENGRLLRIPADFVLLATGFKADMRLFLGAGVRLHGEQEIPEFNPQTMETNVPGLYVAGTAAGGTQERFTYFISTSHDHVTKIVKHITGKVPTRVGTVAARNNSVTWEEVKTN